MRGARLMSTFGFSHYALKIGTAAALLAGCAPIANTGFEAPVASDAIAKTIHHFVAGPKRPDHRSSWMSLDARRINKLLYVSD